MEKLYGLVVIGLFLTAVNTGLIIGNACVLFNFYKDISNKINDIKFEQKCDDDV